MEASGANPDNRPPTVTVDRAGIIRRWDDQVTEVVGRSADEALGRNLNIIIPPGLRSLHWWGFDRAMSRGRMSSGKLTIPALRSDGTIVVAHATIELTYADGGATDGATVTFTGTGPRWQSKAWEALLAPVKVTDRAWHRRHHNRDR